MASVAQSLRRLIVGEPLPTSRAVHERLPKLLALPVFASDATVLLSEPLPRCVAGEVAQIDAASPRPRSWPTAAPSRRHRPWRMCAPAASPSPPRRASAAQPP